MRPSPWRARRRAAQHFARSKRLEAGGLAYTTESDLLVQQIGAAAQANDPPATDPAQSAVEQPGDR